MDRLDSVKYVAEQVLIRREYHQRAAEVGVVRKIARKADGAKPLRSLRKTFSKPDGCPTTDSGHDGEELFAVMHVSNRVTDDPRWCMELIHYLATRLIDCLE